MPNYFTALAADSLRGKRIGVLRFSEGTAQEVEVLYEHALKVLRDAGATLIETQLPPAGKLYEADLLVMYTEFKANLNAYLATTPNAVTTRTLAQLISFNKSSPQEMQLFGQELFINAQATAGVDDDKYREALATTMRLARTEGLDKVLSKDRLDALVAPTTSATWRLDLVSGDRFRGSFSTYPAIAGYPHITLPMGYHHELPLGLSFIGRPWSEPLLLSFAYAFESKAKARKSPKYLPSIDSTLERGSER
ncbi:MAG: hypothetical protein H7Y02_07450 [Candidatus Obscuribacterales bacterium]|nr:hypothetical protein [Steroidobacteraceae bacterium]